MQLNEVFLPLFQSVNRYNVLKGGAGSGKSRAIAQYIIYCVNGRKNFKALAMHKIAEKVKETVFNELVTVIREAGMTHLFHITTSPYKIQHKGSLNSIIFMGVDDPDKLKSIGGINLIWMEEADMFTVDDFNQADTRLRGKCDYPHQLLISFNPTSELSWLKTTFFDDDYGDTLIIESTFRDNAFLDTQYKTALERKGKSDLNFLRVYMNGEWGMASTEGKFYKNFDSYRHVSDDVEYNSGLPIWLSFDFNVQPYCACIISQPQDDDTLHIIDEIALRSPNNTTKYVCQEFARRYPDHVAGVFVTGDPNGKKNDTRSEKGHNDYTLIASQLTKYRPNIRVDSAAPPIVARGNFINAVLHGDEQDLGILISRKCKELVTDLTYQKESVSGKDKSKHKNKDGIVVEKYGHFSDTFDYLIIKLWPSQFSTYQRGPVMMNYRAGKHRRNTRFSL
jgi:phage terminase large subunit